jgi:hypothetical protein
MLAVGPRDVLHPHTAARALHPAQCVQKEHSDAPQGHELEAAQAQAAVGRTRAPAAGASRARALAGPQLDLQPESPRVLQESHGVVHEPGLFLDAMRQDDDFAV